ncbi:MAG: imidazole glycerol phosphate synthase subunit HisH [bacterium]
MRISIVDYGVGNLKSLQNALAYLGVDSSVVSTADEIRGSEKIILPGVGAFGYAMQKIKEQALEPALAEEFKTGAPILGICLGMQLLLSSSEENGRFKGLGFIPGTVCRLEGEYKIPHMGWNEVTPVRECPLTANLPESRFGYFVHSYVCIPEQEEATVATTDYDGKFTSVIAKDHVFGTQFHPEKSQELGLRILKNFAAL